MIAITTVMVFIFICNRFVRFLRFVAQGKYGVNMLAHLVLLQVPTLFGIFLPFGLFLGILFSYGQLYANSEMTVLMVCGMSRKQLLKATMKIAVVTAIVVAILVLWINPSVIARQDKLLAVIRAKTIFQTILPGRFQASRNGQRVFYIKGMSSDRKKLHAVFVAQQLHSKISQTSKKPHPWFILSANKGYQMINKKTGEHFMVAENGYRYKGIPGQKNFEIIKFKTYGVRVNAPSLSRYSVKARALPTSQLLKNCLTNKADMAELQWRLSIPISAIILALLALSICPVKPRQGRFAQFLPAILIYIVYANLLFVSRDWITSGAIPMWLGMWWVHLIFLSFALWLLMKFLGLVKCN